MDIRNRLEEQEEQRSHNSNNEDNAPPPCDALASKRKDPVASFRHFSVGRLANNDRSRLRGTTSTPRCLCTTSNATAGTVVRTKQREVVPNRTTYSNSNNMDAKTQSTGSNVEFNREHIEAAIVAAQGTGMHFRLGSPMEVERWSSRKRRASAPAERQDSSATTTRRRRTSERQNFSASNSKRSKKRLQNNATKQSTSYDVIDLTDSSSDTDGDSMELSSGDQSSDNVVVIDLSNEAVVSDGGRHQDEPDESRYRSSISAVVPNRLHSSRAAVSLRQQIRRRRVSLGDDDDDGPRKTMRTLEEKKAICEGVRELGRGNWTDIRCESRKELRHLTTGQIKVIIT